MTDIQPDIREAPELSETPGQEFVQKVFREDRIRPPAALLEPSTDPTLGTGGIPRARYFDPAFHRLEVEKVWKKTWLAAVWAQDIPKPGQVHVFNLAEISVIIVRQRDGSLKAFRNSCPHRGRQIMDANGFAAQLRCPFHGWTWNLDGTVNQIMNDWDFRHVTPGEACLPTVRLEEWNGFAFINLDDNAPPLLEYLEDVPLHWKDWDLTKRYKAVHVVKHMRANWKVVLEAFIEAYHADATHPQQSPFSACELSEYDVWPGKRHFSRAITLMGYATTSKASPASSQNLSEQQIVERYFSSYLTQGKDEIGTESTRVPEGGSAREVMTRVFAKVRGAELGVNLDDKPTTDVLDGVWYYIFPNFEPWPTLGYPLFYRFFPHGDNPDESMMDIMVLAPFDGERPPSAETIYFGPDDALSGPMGPLGAILDQDIAHFAAVQAGLKASPKDLILGEYQESRIRHYHRTLMEYIEAD